jgi:hypothetical protein
MFAANAVVGKTLKGIIERLFSPLESAVPTIAEAVKLFIEGMIIGYLRAEVALYDLANGLLTYFRPAIIAIGRELKNVDWYKLTTGLGILATSIPAAALTAVGVSLTLIGTGATAAFLGLKKLKELLSGTSKLWDDQKTGWQNAGNIVIDGLINGLLGGWPRVIGQIRKLGSKLLGAFKNSIDAHSPSRLFMQEGFNIGAGVEKGIRIHTPKVNAAVRHMVEAPQRRARPVRLEARPAPARYRAAPPPRAAERSGATVRIEGGIHVHTDSSNPKQLAREIRAELRNALEGAAIEMGAA